MNDAQNPGVELATKALGLIQQIGGPIVALGIALLALTITIAVIAYVMSRTPTNHG